MSTDNHLPGDNESLMREFIKKELKELEVQQEQIKQNKEIAELEAETLRHKHELDHDIAVRGINAQLEDRKKQMDTAKQMQANDKLLWITLMMLVFFSVLVAFISGFGKEIIELAKYAIGAIVGYLAGVAKGKFDKNSSRNIAPPEE